MINQLPGPERLRSGEQTSFVFNPVAESNIDENALEDAREIVRDLLGPSPVTVDELVRNCQLSLAYVSAALVELELAGRLERLSGNRVQLRIER